MTTAHPAPQLPPCELCGGPQVGNLGVKSHYHVGIHPHGRQLWSKPLSTLSAVVCLHCGHTKLFADDLAKVRDEAERHPDRFVW